MTVKMFSNRLVALLGVGLMLAACASTPPLDVDALQAANISNFLERGNGI